jgi:predicted dehydrogenase
VNVGVLGCGLIAAYHIPHILRDKRVTRLSIADLDQSQAARIAERYAIKHVYSDFESMNKAQTLDVVHILTPPQTHADLAIKAMEAGCHTLVEKPMALTVADADAMVKSARKNGVKLGIDHNFLFNPVVVAAQSLVESGAVGHIAHVEVHYNFDIKRVSSKGTNLELHWSSNLLAGLTSDLLPHSASLLLQFMGSPTGVYAVQKSNDLLPNQAIDELRVLADSERATGLLSLSMGARPDCFTLTIYGTEMSIHANLSNMTLVKRRNRNVPRAAVRVLDNVEQAMQILGCTFANTFKIMTGKVGPPGDVGPAIADFYTSIESNSEPFSHGEAGKQVIEFIARIYNECFAVKLPLEGGQQYLAESRIN